MMILIATFLSVILPVFGAVHESLHALPYGWSLSRRQGSSNTVISLQVALKYQCLDQLESRLASVSTPGSAQYGQYLDVAELNSLFGPSNQSANDVSSWLKSSGATNIVNDGSIISFVTTVANANQMLDTNFQVYTNGKMDKLRTRGYSIPDSLSNAIDFISPTTYFGNTKARRVVPRTPSIDIKRDVLAKRQYNQTCEKTIQVPVSRNRTVSVSVIGPECLKELYNIGNYTVDPKAGSNIAFGSFLNQSANRADLASFEKIWNLPSNDFQVLALINGGMDDQDPATAMNGEANLDVQNIIGLVDGLPVGEYITGGLPPFIPDLLSPNASSNQNEPYLEYYQYLLSQPNSNLPYVISNSYGDDENTVPEYYARRVCYMIGMMGLRGRTILESSGDAGVGAACRNNEPPFQPQFTPEFPATCPYITAVGGTQFVDPEVAWNASTGGFSNYFKTAWYQKDAVNTYLNNYINATAKEYYSSNNYTNFSGRGFPDISAHSNYPYYLTVVNGTAQPVAGTSASVPVVGAIMALLNDARLRAGKPALGFVNPWLYQGGAVGLNDITNGTVVGCGGVNLQTEEVVDGAGIIPYATWNATVGWDPATGLGTPNFQKLKDLALSI